MADTINVGILGFAHGHVGTFGGQWMAHPELGIRVVAGYDRNTSLADNYRGIFTEMKVCSSAEEVLSSDISAVVVASETSYHCQYVEMAAEAGKAIICYKPMAITLAEADRMVAAVEKYNVPFTIGYQARVDRQNQKIKELIQNKTIGETFYYRRRHGLTVHVEGNGFENVWHNDPVLNRDIFADDSSHPIDMMNWIFGMPESVSCEMSSMCKGGKIPNDIAVATFKYANGMIAEISAVMSCSAADITTEVYGSKGSISQIYGDNPSCRLPHGTDGLKWYIEGDGDWTHSDIPSPSNQGERIAAEYLPLAQFLKGEAGPLCDVYEGRDALKLVLACYLSAREGKRVSVNDERLYEI